MSLLANPVETRSVSVPRTGLSLLMPVFNEEAILDGALRRCVLALERHRIDFEILVINDGSTDRTAEIAERMAREDPRVRVLHNERNLNYGISLKRGIRAARHEWVFHNGADLPLAPEDLDRFLPHFDDTDVLVARRLSRKAHSPWRKLTSWTHNRLVHLLFSPRTLDLNFVQFYRRSAIAGLPLTSNSPAFVTPELILRAERAGLRVREVPVEFRHRQAGQAHFGRLHDILWTLKDMLKMRLRTWRHGWQAGSAWPRKDILVPMIPLARPCFGVEEERQVLQAIRSGWVTQGPKVEELEEQFADAVQASHAVAVSSGTAGLFLALHALGIGRGDEVIVPSLSFIATANAISHCGATPIFVDVDPRTYNVHPQAVDSAVTGRTRAVMVVHQLGLPADLDELQRIAGRHHLPLVEDAACAVGARYRGAPIGSSGNLACFSFHPRKVLVTGEGGMITTSDGDLAHRLRRLRHQGMSASDLERHRNPGLAIEEYPELGYNFRMSDLHAAMGLAQLPKLAEMVEERQRLGSRYDAALRSLPEVEVRSTPDYASPNYQSYIFRLRGVDRETRNELLGSLQRRGVSSRRGLMASHLEPCHRRTRARSSLEHTVAADAQTLLLPIYNSMSVEDQSYVIDQLQRALDELASRRQPGKLS